MSESPVPVSAAMIDAKARFSEFLERNPKSILEEIEAPDGKKQFRIARPWGDESVAIVLPEDHDALATVLNKLLLPERFAAVWHSDTKRLEVVWTAFRLSASQREIFGRKFQFTFKGKKHDCAFDKSSERLNKVARYTLPQGMSDTNHRNMQSFYHHALGDPQMIEALALEEPKSFWINNVTWNENKVIELAQNINFYLTYYDDSSPSIVIFPPPFQSNSTARRTRYIHGNFPSTVKCNGLNDNLIGFWSAADTGNPLMRFILYYRIIEYASHHYVDEDVKAAIRKLLSNPSIGDKIAEAIESITDIVSVKRNEDIPKFKGLISKCLDPKLLWREAVANRAVFSKETRFEGDFVVKALLHEDEKEAAFCQNGLDRFCDLTRRIRNALSHGRDQETGGVIAATTRNYQLLRPWVHLMGTAAGEVVIYKDIA